MHARTYADGWHDRNVLGTIKATEISYDSDAGKYLTFEGPIPAVQISAAVE